MLTLTIQLKDQYADKNFTPQETAYWTPCLVAAAMAIQQLNVLFADQMIHGPLKSNPEAEQVELMLGDVCTPPNECGVMTVTIQDYSALKIPYLPESVPFIIYLGDTSEKVQKFDADGNPVVDEQGNPIYETVLAPKISGQ